MNRSSGSLLDKERRTGMPDLEKVIERNDDLRMSDEELQQFADNVLYDYDLQMRNGVFAVSQTPLAVRELVLRELERNERRIKEATDEFYNALIAEKREEIERLKAEIAKMPPLDYVKLAENPPSYPVVLGFTCGSVTPKEEEDET